MENSFKSLIDNSNSILILLPTKPYFDQVAAGLSLYLALREKKEVNIFSPTPMTVGFNRLVGVNKVVSEIGNKNLIIKFKDYKATNVERVSTDIENNQFFLTVIPKPGFSSPKKGQVELSYSGVSADTVFLIGGANESHFPALTSLDLIGRKLVHIGIRGLIISPEKSVISFAEPASSISEIVANLIKEGGLTVDSDIATDLLMGIEEGSKQFTGPDVTAATFQAVADLLRAGGQRIPRERGEVAAFAPVAILAHKQDKKKPKEPPKDWLAPKIYKGTTVS